MKDVTDSVEAKLRFQQKFKRWQAHWRKQGPKNIRYLYIVWALIMFLYFYIKLPALNYAVLEFWMFLFIGIAGIVVIELLHDGGEFIKSSADHSTLNFKGLSLKYKCLLYPWPLIALLGLVIYLATSPIFIADKYANMIKIQEANFAEDFPPTDLSQVPLIDRDTAMRLGSRKLGSLSKLVSQFEVADDYTQINIKSQPVRVTPLKYAGFFKWLNNFQAGIPHYLQVDTVTGDVTVMTPDQPIKYSNADKFNRNIMRHLRFNYPFSIFSRPSFEVDDQGQPYYIATTYRRNFILREPEADGVILVNAMTGETKKYNLKDTPSWIDRVYSADIMLHQISMRGLYQGGFFNSLFAKAGVTEPTEGYNYIPLKDDLYLYTGLTSVAADDSNIGFVLVNLRTKESKIYTLDAAEEFSAMRSAEGSVQETEYQATFPLLVNLDGRAMYVLTLKDNSGLIRKYALVDAQNYQKVYVESSVEQLLTAYQADNNVNVTEVSNEEVLKDIQGQVENIQAVVVDGNSVYYFMIDGDIYQADIHLSRELPFMKEGQMIEFKANEQGQIKEIKQINE